MNAGTAMRPQALLSRTLPAWLAMLVLLSTVASPLAAAPDDLLAIPAEAARLVPVGTVLVVALSSLDDAEREWQDLAAAFGSKEADRDYSLMSTLGDGLPGLDAIAGRSQPLLVAVGLAGLLGGAGPDLTFIFPVAGDLAQLKYLGEGSPFVTLYSAAGYAALSNAPDYKPATTPPKLEIPRGILAASLELGTTLQLALPFFEMGMSSMAIGQPDSTGALAPPVMSAEQLEILSASLRTMARCAQRVELAVRRDGDRYKTLNRLFVLPGSELSPGTQPSFKDALALTTLLPPGTDLVQVMAMDTTRPFAVFKPLYLADMQRTAAALDAETAALYEAWFADYLGLLPLTAQPMAASLYVRGPGAVVHAIMETRDAADAFKSVTSLLDRLSDLPLPFRVQPVDDAPFKDAQVRAYEIVFDAALMPETAGERAESAAANLGQVATLFQKLTPEIRLAQVGRHLLVSVDRERGSLETMIAACKSSEKRGQPDPRLQMAAERGEAHVQEIIVGDLTTMLRWVAGAAAAIDSASHWDALAELGPVPCEMTLSAWDGGYAGTYSVLRKDLLRLAEALAKQDP